MKSRLFLKKFVSITLALSILMSTFLFIPTVSAAETVDVSENNIIMNSEFYKKYGQAVEKIAEGISNYESTIDIENFEVPKNKKRELIETTLCTHPELFYIQKYSSAYENSKYVTCMCFTYDEEPEELDKKRFNFEKAANEYINKTDSLPNNHMLRALTLHDELGLQVESVSSEQRKNGIYNTMIEGVGNSRSYACVYAYLLSKLGIKNEIVKSGNNYWNKVCYNGKYYNVDIYGDSWYATAKITHKRFFISDKKMTELTGREFTSYTESDTTYDNHAFHETDSRICYYKKDWYMIRNDYLGTNTRSLIKYRLSSDTEEIIRKFPEKWKNYGEYVWASAFSGLDIYNGILYFNTPNEIRTYDLRDNTEGIFTENIYNSEFYSVKVEDGKVYAATAYGTEKEKRTLRYIGEWNNSVKYIHFFDDFTEIYGDVVDKVATAIKNYETSVDISEYKIPAVYDRDSTHLYCTPTSEIMYGYSLKGRLIDIIYYSHPELFFIEYPKENSEGKTGFYVPISVTYYTKDNKFYFKKINIEYPYTPEEMDEIRRKFDEKVEWYLKDVDDNWSDLQKMTFIHDRMCNNITYKKGEELNARIYQAMFEGVGNCVSYSLIFSYLLSEVGIHSEIIKTNDHLLNKVFIDGNWYVVDATWNDEDSSGKINRKYYMISDETRKNFVDYQTFFFTYYNSSNSFEDEAVRTYSDAPICFIGDDWYTIKGKTSEPESEYDRCLLKYNTEDKEITIINKFTEKWGGLDWVYSGLAEYNGLIYYNTPDTIYYYDTKTGTKDIFTKNSFDQPFVNLSIHDGILYAETANIKDLSQRKLEYIGECIGRTEEKPVDKDEPLDIKNVTIVGNGNEYWLNGKQWQADALENKMRMVNSAYTITFKGLKYNPDGYKFNFAVNNSSESLFGWKSSQTHGNVTIGNLGYGEKSLTFNIPKDYYAADVTIDFNFGGYDSTNKTGATFAINITEVKSELPETLRLAGNGKGNWLNGKSYNYTGTSNTLAEKDGVYKIRYKNVQNNNDVFKYYFMNGNTFFDAQNILSETPFTVTIPEKYYSADIMISMDLRNYDPATKTGAKNSVSLSNKIPFGDATFNNTLSVEDVTAVQMYVSKTNTFTADQQNVSDVNADDKVDIDDATYMQLYLAKKIEKMR